MKTVIVFAADQNRKVDHPSLLMEVNYADFIKSMPELKDSKGLKDVFANAYTKEIFILLYTLKGSEKVRRRIAGYVDSMNDDERKEVMSMLAESVGIKLEFHDIPSNPMSMMRKADREIIKSLRMVKGSVSDNIIQGI